MSFQSNLLLIICMDPGQRFQMSDLPRHSCQAIAWQTLRLYLSILSQERASNTHQVHQDLNLKVFVPCSAYQGKASDERISKSSRSSLSHLKLCEVGQGLNNSKICQVLRKVGRGPRFSPHLGLISGQPPRPAKTDQFRIKLKIVNFNFPTSAFEARMCVCVSHIEKSHCVRKCAERSYPIWPLLKNKLYRHNLRNCLRMLCSPHSGHSSAPCCKCLFGSFNYWHLAQKHPWSTWICWATANSSTNNETSCTCTSGSFTGSLGALGALGRGSGSVPSGSTIPGIPKNTRRA